MDRRRLQRDTSAPALVQPRDLRDLDAYRLLCSALEWLPDGTVVIDSQLTVSYANPAAVKLLGDRWRGQSARSLLAHFDPPATEPVMAALENALRTGDPGERVAEALVEGERARRTVELSVLPLGSDLAEIDSAMILFREPAIPNRGLDELSYRASHDPLTGLFNRWEFSAMLSNLLAQAERDNAEHAVCFMDLDYFKIINDQCGHETGDNVLQQIGDKLKHWVRKGDVVARLGGDEFAFIFHNCAKTDAVRLGEEILTCVATVRIEHRDRTYGVGASLGLVSIHRPDMNASDVMRSADEACYEAKKAGRNQLRVSSAPKLAGRSDAAAR
jgi:diguanylate cyclase (GGDEF)-like protein